MTFVLLMDIVSGFERRHDRLGAPDGDNGALIDLIARENRRRNFAERLRPWHAG